MIKNNKGFSMVELLAMIIITTVLIYPLMQSLVKNVEINERFLSEQSATTVANSTLYGLGKINFANIYSLVVLANTDGDYYIEINADNCSDLAVANVADETICTNIFGIVSNNFTAGSAEYKVFIYNYALSQTYFDALTAETNTNIPDEVKVEIEKLTPVPDLGYTSPESILRVTVWIQYYNEPPYYVVLSGLIVDETN